MKCGVKTRRFAKLSPAIVYMSAWSLAFVLLLLLIGQSDLDDRHAVVGARLLRAKVFRQDTPINSGFAHFSQLSLAVGSQLFTPGYVVTFVRIPRRQESVDIPSVSFHSGRSPPRSAAC